MSFPDFFNATFMTDKWYKFSVLLGSLLLGGSLYYATTLNHRINIKIIDLQTSSTILELEEEAIASQWEIAEAQQHQDELRARELDLATRKQGLLGDVKKLSFEISQFNNVRSIIGGLSFVGWGLLSIGFIQWKSNES